MKKSFKSRFQWLRILCCALLMLSGTTLSISAEWNKQAAFAFLEKIGKERAYQSYCGHDKALTKSLYEIPAEMFSSMLILDLLIDSEFDENIKKDLIKKIQSNCSSNGLYRFFTKESLLPADVDSTALAYISLTKAKVVDESLLKQALESIVKNVNNQGIIEVYLDPNRAGRIDPVVCANVLYLLCLYGMRDRAVATEEFLYKTLIAEDYNEGTLYYPSGDAYLYMISRLLDFPDLRKKFADPLAEKLKKRINTTDNPFDLAMRVICAKKLGLTNDLESQKLAKMQHDDGGWTAWTFFKNGKSKNAYAKSLSMPIETIVEYYGSREIMTAFAVKALTII